MITQPTIFVVEPDPVTCESIRKVANFLELRCEAYATGPEFLEAFDRHRPGCLVLEVRIPGMNGLQIQQNLVNMGATLPVIFLTTATSVSIAVHAMRIGALHFLEKPFHEHELWTAIQEAIQIDQDRRKAKSEQEGVDAQVGILSEKEIAVLELLADCKTKRVMAEELGVSIRTVEHHRTQLMRKLKINSIAGLLHFALSMTRSRPRLFDEPVQSGSNGNGFGVSTTESLPSNSFQVQRPTGPRGRRNS